MLYAHQVTGAERMGARRRLYLGDVPGTGKTYTALQALVLAGCWDALVVCPAIVRSHWRRVAAAFAYDYAFRVTVKSYDEITRGGEALRATLLPQIDALILDEAHFLKHHTSQRAKLLLGRDGYARAPHLKAVFPLSGTPVSKNPSDIWTILSAIFPDVARKYAFGSRNAFLARLCFVSRRKIHNQWVEQIAPGCKDPVLLRNILDDVMLRRTLDDVGLDVPPLEWQTVALDGDPLPDGVDDFLELDRQIHTYPEMMPATAEERGEIARARRLLGESKVDATVRLLRQQLVDSDEKVVVFAHHRNVLDGLEAGLVAHGIEVVRVDGGTTPAARDVAIDRFQTQPSVRVFLGQNIACQTGITLTAARRVVLVEPDWTRDVNLQLAKRVARIGQTATHCIVQQIVLASSLDNAIVQRNDREGQMADEIGLGVA